MTLMSTMTLAFAMTVAVATVSPSRATPATTGLRPGQMITQKADGLLLSIVSECYWKKVCAKWVSTGWGHSCLRWTQKKVCRPPLDGAKAPPSKKRP
jgi:hypothetical protein